MLIDTTHCCDDHANEALEDLFFKAASEPPDIWDEHESPFVRRMIELFTERGLLRFGKLQEELMKWLDGGMYREGERPASVPGHVTRWTPGELALVKLYLETLPPDEFTADDWMMCVDYLAQRYFPDDQAWLEAEWLATKASIMGRVQSRMAELSEQQAERLLIAAPATIAAAEQRFGMTVVQRAMLQYGRARCAENIVTVADGVRQRVKALILEYQRQRAIGDPTLRESMQTRLQDAFATANTDWRRIAVTEAGEMANQGLIASVGPGGRVRRVEQYKGACAFCRSIDGKEFDVVAANATNKNGWTQVWPGKTNVGRSAAPRKRVAGQLIDREPVEMWWPAAGTQHPHCRGIWIRVTEPDRAGDEKFSAWLKATLEKTE